MVFGGRGEGGSAAAACPVACVKHRPGAVQKKNGVSTTVALHVPVVADLGPLISNLGAERRA
jgi:hypothetical protein